MTQKNTAETVAEVKIASVEELDAQGFKTTAAKIRHLSAQGMARGAIAKHLGIRYQWVRNVLITPIGAK